MNCFECGGVMEVTFEDRPYQSLPGVTLLGVEVRRCSCGEEEVVIPKIEALDRAIARAIVTSPARLTGPEIRFLRKFLGWSGADFARNFSVDKATVSKWENDVEGREMSTTLDRFLRTCVVTETPIENYLDSLKTVAVGERRHATYSARMGAGVWEATAA